MKAGFLGFKKINMGHLILRVLAFMILLSQMSACTTHYSALVYIEFQPNLYHSNWRQLREVVKKTINSECKLIRTSTGDHAFTDFYQCGNNLYVSAGIYNVSVSFEQKKRTPNPEKWKSIAKKLWENIYPGWPSAHLGRHVFEIKDGVVSHVRHEPKIEISDIM
jgi:hypothetical protein